jgi:ABC-2 type transport system ATP-binding protein
MITRVTLALATRGLTKTYGTRTAVDHLSIEVPSGSVTGFVGPNGSGKTTTIRMLLGLVGPSEGSAEVLGGPISRPRAYLHRVGAMIEAPAFQPAISGRRNLTSLAVLGGLPRSRVQVVLERVGLGERGDDAVKKYSLGMKQRLGIAAALLPDPELMVLDEPTNGLDPSGIREVRALLRSFTDEGRTVFVSSHLLSELQEVCDHVVIITQGALRYQGDVAGLRSGGAAQVRAVPEHPADLGRLAEVARGLDPTSVTSPDGVIATTDAARLNRAAHDAGITLVELTPQRQSLEDAFFRLVSEQDGQL